MISSSGVDESGLSSSLRDKELVYGNLGEVGGVELPGMMDGPPPHPHHSSSGSIHGMPAASTRTQWWGIITRVPSRTHRPGEAPPIS